MKINFNEDEIKALEEIDFKVKDNYSDEDLVSLEERVADELINHFDKNDEPLPKALVYESILDKLSEAV